MCGLSDSSVIKRSRKKKKKMVFFVCMCMMAHLSVHVSGRVSLFLLCLLCLPVSHSSVYNMWRRSELIMMHGVFAWVVNLHLRILQWPPTASFTPQNKNWHNLFHAPFQIPFPSAPLPIFWVRQLLLWQVLGVQMGKWWRLKGGKKYGEVVAHCFVSNIYLSSPPTLLLLYHLLLAVTLKPHHLET